MKIVLAEEKYHLGGKYFYYKNLEKGISECNSNLTLIRKSKRFYNKIYKANLYFFSKIMSFDYSVKCIELECKNYCKTIFLLSKKVKPDLIHIQHPLEAYYISHSVWRDIPIVQTVHSFWLKEIETNLISFELYKKIKEIQIFSYCYIRHFVSLNSLQYNQLIKAGISQDKITIIANTVDKISVNENADLFPFIFKGQYLSVVCRLSPEKGVDVAIRALALISEELRPNLIIVGDGPQKKYLINLVNELQVSKFIRFLGVLDHSSALGVMKGSILNLCPSINYNGIQDTAPLSVLESIALDVPVAASRIGGLPEYIVHGRNGYLFNENDALALSEIICEHIKSVNNGGISDMKNFMQEHSHEFSSKSWIDKYIDLYQKVINAGDSSYEDS